LKELLYVFEGVHTASRPESMDLLTEITSAKIYLSKGFTTARRFPQRGIYVSKRFTSARDLPQQRDSLSEEFTFAWKIPSARDLRQRDSFREEFTFAWRIPKARDLRQQRDWSTKETETSKKRLKHTKRKRWSAITAHHLH
jgi:hypothetical protein